MDKSEIGMIRIKWDVYRHHMLLSNHERLIGWFSISLTVVNTARRPLSYLKVLKLCYNSLVVQHPCLQSSFSDRLYCGPAVGHTYLRVLGL